MDIPIPAVNQKKIRHILASNPLQDNTPDITTKEAWQTKRDALHSALWQLLGEPSQTTIPEPNYTVLEEIEQPNYRQLKISYEAEPGEEVRAYLLLPPVEKRLQNAQGKSAAVLCLHGTSLNAKSDNIGENDKEGRDYGKFLASHGFIVFAPDHVCAGERLPAGVNAYDTAPFYERHPAWSAVGKAIWDGSRALDILEQIPEIDITRVGAVGNSLGGHGSMWVAAFDQRIRAAISSCGLTTWGGNPKRSNWARDSWYRYIPNLRAIFDEQEKNGGPLPVEMHEFAALIAPRAFLNISGMADAMYDNNETLPEVGLQLATLWQLLEAPEGFANFLFGGGHDVPLYSSQLTLGWFQYWLKADQ